MKSTMKRALKTLLLQALILVVLSAAVPLAAVFLGASWLLTAGYWALLPLAGFFTALRVTRRGVSCYLGWILPPILMSITPWLLVGYPPYAGSMLLCVLTSMIGAAAGDVMNRRKEE